MGMFVKGKCPTCWDTYKYCNCDPEDSAPAASRPVAPYRTPLPSDAHMWRLWCCTWQLRGFSAPKAMFDELATRYSEPHRHYHNLLHVKECLDALSLIPKNIGDRFLVELAVWFHGAVYCATDPVENEELSALLAQESMLSSGIPLRECREVSGMICQTDYFSTRAGSANSEAVCSADLAILGANAERYDEYSRQIRQEYGHVNDDEFEKGRVAFLNSLLEEQFIFPMEASRVLWECAARENIASEIRRLEKR